MNRFVVLLNIGRFRDLLAKEPDAEKRRLLERLLADEEETLRRIDGEPPASGGDPEVG